MSKYVSIEIPTKKYIKAFLIGQLGAKLIVKKNTWPGHMLYDLLNHQSNENQRKQSSRYNTQLKLYISVSIMYHRGIFMNYNNIKRFNLFLESEIKERFHFYMDSKIEILPSFEANLPYVREKLGLDIEAWDSDSMKKDYYRYRVKTGKDLLYKKNF